MSVVIFYVLALGIIVTGILAVTSRQIFRSAIYLLGSLVGIAGLYFWLSMEFIAAVQIIVYVGGIVVLIIFSIFLTQQSGKEMPKTPSGRNAAALIGCVAGFIFTVIMIYQQEFNISAVPFDNSVERIGLLLLNTGDGGFVLPFEVVSLLLLAAMIGCIVIAIKPNTEKHD